MNKRPPIPQLSRQPRLAVFLFSLFTALAPFASALAETVNIGSAADWAAFAGRVNAGETSLDARLTAEVTLSQDSPFVGTDTDHAYMGTFDGDGHKLAVAWRFTDGTEHVAPFRFVSSCTIKNLHIAGTLESNGKFVAGFVGECLRGNSGAWTSISNCRSSVAITCSISGDATSAGFLGHLANDGNAKVRFEDCLFDGSLLGPSATCCGGFTGYRPSAAYARYYNSLFSPEALTVSGDGSYTISRNGHDGMSYTYYTQTLGSADGTSAASMSAEALVSRLGTAWTVSGGKAALALFPFPAVPPVAAVDGFTYQGALKDISGAPLAGEKTVQFRLYDAATGGTPLWGRSCKVLLDANGLFNTEISDAAGAEIEGVPSANLAAILARNSASPLYAGLAVSGADGEIAPRQRLLSVPYATYAADTANAAGDFAVAGELSAGGLGVSGQTSIGGDTTVKGNAAVTGKLGVTGKIAGRGSAPPGIIVVWSGNANRIPDGWALCDGSNGTPDLRGRFVVGYDERDGDYNAPGKTGGETRHTLTEAQMPSHRHSYTFRGADLTLEWDNDNYFYDLSGHYDRNGNTKYTDYVGGSQSHENRPPYFALCYIMRVK